MTDTPALQSDSYEYIFQPRIYSFWIRTKHYLLNFLLRHYNFLPETSNLLQTKNTSGADE